MEWNSGQLRNAFEIDFPFAMALLLSVAPGPISAQNNVVQNQEIMSFVFGKYFILLFPGIFPILYVFCGRVKA